MSETADVSHLLITRDLEGDSAPEPEGPTWASELGSSPWFRAGTSPQSPGRGYPARKGSWDEGLNRASGGPRCV